MGSETCPKVTLIIVDVIISLFALSTIVTVAIDSYNNHYFYPSGFLIVLVILGIVGVCIRSRVLLMISAIMGWVLAAVQLADVIVMWVVTQDAL